MLKELLKQKGLRVSKQRLHILAYLRRVRKHPTAEDVYLALRGADPAISLATVYNTLNTFLEAGLIRELSLGEGSKRYDIDCSLHGHFYCLSCQKVANLPYTPELESALNSFAEQQHNQEVYASEVKLIGLCQSCRH